MHCRKLSRRLLHGLYIRLGMNSTWEIRGHNYLYILQHTKNISSQLWYEPKTLKEYQSSGEKKKSTARTYEINPKHSVHQSFR